MTGAKILIVEDEVIVAEVIAAMLRQLGYQVTAVVSSGEAAIAKATDTQPDLVLMDIFLQGKIDGIAAAWEIGDRLDIPVIYLTAHSDPVTLQRAKKTAPFGYIVKPFTENNLQVAIELGLEQYKREAFLKQRNQSLAPLLESMSDGVVATDEQGIITFMNPAAEAMTGWTQAEAIGQAFADIFHLINQKSEQPIENPVMQVLRDREVVYLENYAALIHRNGTLVPIGDSASPINEKSGSIKGAVLVFWNSRDRSPEQVLETTLEKQKEFNRLKAQFLSIVSHEFRNPLSTILSSTGLLQLYSTKWSEVQNNEQLAQIEEAVQQMNQLIESLLVASRAESGRLPFQSAPLDLVEFSRNLALEILQSTGDIYRLIFCVTGECFNASMDRNLLNHIFNNLLSNAFKYSLPGSTVWFQVNCDPAESVVTFEIQDRGIGIPDSDRTDLFESFYRGENVGDIPGSGLGLAIVKQCVNLHKGEINFTSEVGVGTTFTVRLPLVSNSLNLE